MNKDIKYIHDIFKHLDDDNVVDDAVGDDAVGDDVVGDVDKMDVVMIFL